MSSSKGVRSRGLGESRSPRGNNHRSTPVSGWSSEKTSSRPSGDHELDQLDLNFDVQPRGGLRLSLTGQLGESIDYTNARAGTIVRLTPRLESRLGRKLELTLDHAFERLSVPEGRVFTAQLTQGRLVYNFGPRAFARAIVQHTQIDRNIELYAVPAEPRSRQLFSQLLFSYKVNPQTVLLLGYTDAGQELEEVELTRTDRTFFLKIGYAWVL